MRLSAKQLLAETAKFFSIHPDRFLTGRLVSGNKSPAQATEQDCFCTVGYMAYRLAQADPVVRKQLINGEVDAYDLVTRTLRQDGVNVSSNELYRENDSAKRPAPVVGFLKGLIRA